MIPRSYFEFMVASTSAAAALIGLLFVAISMRAELIFGPGALPRTRTLASSSFTGLVNAFVLALLAVIPHSNLGFPTILMAVVSLYRSVQRHQRAEEVQNYLLLLSCGAYLFELVVGAILVVQSHNTFCLQSICYLIFTSFVISLSRAWKLIASEVPEKATP